MTLHQIILKKLKKLPKSKSPWLPENYIGGDLKHLNLSAPTLKAAFKDGFDFESTFENWNQVWQTSDTFEVMSCSLLYLNTLPDKGLRSCKKVCLWSERVNNWAHADGLSHFLSLYLEQQPKVMLPILKKWNRSQNPWKVRLSLVSLFYYSRMRVRSPSFSLVRKMLKPHLKHPHLFVQKGVGWTLRECYNVYPEATLKFLFENVRAISPTAWYASTEKLSLVQKRKLLRKRKTNV